MDDLCFNYLRDKSVFVSGAGGSIGSELVRQILGNHPKTLILYELCEFNLYKILEECKQFIKEKDIGLDLYPILGDVRNFNQLKQTFQEIPIDIVFHAAAYKHVPLVEMSDNIVPSIENNVLGTFNLCKISAIEKVRRFVLISTDKAVRPTNIMGASKRLAELVCQGFAKEHPETIYSMVRFGNVINSSGSVIPMFREQISNGGPVTITHKNITRYFMTIPEAASLVISAGINSLGGEVFLLDMGEQIRVYDLAERMIRLSGRSVSKEKGDGGIEIIDIGLRPGEKMFEELLISGNEEKTNNDKIFKSLETSLSFKDMVSVVTELKECIDSVNVNKIMNILKSRVDGYNPQS
jgi:FlaA1/EpsC-like NDP-sugar epimerase